MWLTSAPPSAILSSTTLTRGSAVSIVQAPNRPTHELGSARFTALATPTRGSTESSVWTVEIDPGAPATPHSLTREEVFVILDGVADVTLGGIRGTAGPGDAVVVPADVDFEITNG